MAAGDKGSDERCQYRSFERDRGKRRRPHRSASPFPPEQRRKRSRPPGAEEKHRHKNSAEKHEDSTQGHELSNRNTEGLLSEEDKGREVTKKNGLEDDEKAGVRKSCKENRKVELHSSRDSSGDAYSNSESDRGSRKKSRSKHHRSRKSKRKHRRHVHSESEQDESQYEGTSEESSEDIEDRAKTRKQLKRKERAKRERKAERRRKKMKRKMKGMDREQEKRMKKKEVEKLAKALITDDLGDCLEGGNLRSESSNNEPILEPKHKIFLSHSGAQKEFVEYLCKALEDCCHYPFFDRRDESLPKGERFPELIVQAAKQCEMFIVVVSDEYFMSKWPMIELNAFVKARKLHHGSNIGPKILPLFYRLSVSDLFNEKVQKKWFQKWKTLAEADPNKRINVSDWKVAFYALRTFNGLSYDMNSREVVAYIDKIVSHVCTSIPPDIKWDDSHVQGKSNICKVIFKKVKELGLSQNYQVKKVGIYGVGGIGKTTTCKTLCNEYLSKYEGRVCHIEFPSVSPFESKDLLQKVVRDLTRKSMEVIQPLDAGQCMDVLRKSVPNQKTFLAIDNISDSDQSIMEAKRLLDLRYHKDSLVFVTARSQSVLERLGIDEDACLEMPDLGEVDAMNLFLLHAASGKQFFEVEERRDIMTCIKRCYFSKGNGQDHHYHPLALQALGVQLGWDGKRPCEWVKNLSQVKALNDFAGESPVLRILRGSFDMLSRDDQILFMDVGFFALVDYSSPYSRIEWLCAIYKQDERAILLRVERLKRKGLVQDVDLDHGGIIMHDLYLEFAKLEASASYPKSPNSRERMWMYMENGDLTNLESNCWHNLIRLSIREYSVDFKKHPNVGWIGGIEGWNWNYFSHVQVLKLSWFHGGHGALNLEGLMQLRILQLDGIYEIDGVGGLEKLKHLTLFVWSSNLGYTDEIKGSRIVGQLPSSLKQLVLDLPGVVRSDVLGQCNNLVKLELSKVEVHSLDLSNCLSLESVHLDFIVNLQTVLIGNACFPSHLQELHIKGCDDLVDIRGIDHLIDLKKLQVSWCYKWKVPSLLTYTKLQVLIIQGQLVVSLKDCFPFQLEKIGEGLNLSGLNELEVLDLSGTTKLTSLAKVGDLPSLRHLNLNGCRHLLRLPNLSASRSLKELDLDECLALEFHEEEIQMLCELPMLEPVLFSGMCEGKRFRLDFARRKVLIHSHIIPPAWDLWKADEWEERDLGAAPLKIGRRGIWDEVDPTDWDQIEIEATNRMNSIRLKNQLSGIWGEVAPTDWD